MAARGVSQVSNSLLNVTHDVFACRFEQNWLGGKPLARAGWFDG
jgi:hypothetical protein